jgi:hypothetical protein
MSAPDEKGVPPETEGNPIETLIEACDREELPGLLQRASDEQLGKWEALVQEEDNRLLAVIDHPEVILFDRDKLQAIEDRQDAVSEVQWALKEEQEKRAAKP